METYDTFDQIPQENFRAFNRVIMAANIKNDLGQAPLEEYIGLFSLEDQLTMMSVTEAIKANGLDATRKEVTKDIEFTEDGDDLE